MKNNLKLIILLLLLLSMLLVACVPSNTTSTAETSDIISDTDTSNSESKAQIPPDESDIETSEAESHQWIDTSDINDDSISDESAVEEKWVGENTNANIAPICGEFDMNYVCSPYPSAVVDVNLPIIKMVLEETNPEMVDAFEVTVKSFFTDARYNKAMETPPVYEFIKIYNIQKEDFIRANEKYKEIKPEASFTDEQIELLFSGEPVDTITKGLLRKIAWYHDGRVYNVDSLYSHALWKWDVLVDLNKDGEVAEFFQSIVDDWTYLYADYWPWTYLDEDFWVYSKKEVLECMYPLEDFLLIIEALNEEQINEH
ncbi:MAG: hypothetical protein J6L23_06130 [Clostridia bacterium]|nr:hypothetical protein [Clostridia bacterium]